MNEPLDLDKMQELAGKATPGPWEGIVDTRHGIDYAFVRTVKKIIKNDPGKFPPEYPDQILSEDSPNRENDVRWVAECSPEKIARLIRMLKQVTVAARALIEAVEDSAEAAAVDQNNSHDEWRTDRPTEYKAWEDMRAALAYNGEPDA